MDAHGHFYMDMRLNLENISGNIQTTIKGSKFPDSIENPELHNCLLCNDPFMIRA